MTHSPDNPFGCCEQHGPRLAALLPEDMLLHVCNKNTADHDGSHECKCGQLWPR